MKSNKLYQNFWVSTLVLLGLVLFFLYLLISINSNPKDGLPHRLGGHDIFEKIRLIDQTNQLFDPKILKQKNAIIYFGYTFCPDVCPVSLALLSNTLDKIGKDHQRFQPIFISVDLKRDTPIVLNKYVSFFHPSLLGLVGTEDDLKKLTDYFGVYYEIMDEKVDDLNYLVNHSSLFLMIKPDGSYRPLLGIKKVDDLVRALKHY